MYTENSTCDQCHTIQTMVSVADKCDWTCSSAVEEECGMEHTVYTIFVVSAEILLLRVQAHIQVPTTCPCGCWGKQIESLTSEFT